MKYKIVNQNNMYNVYECFTEQNIESFKKYNDSKKYCHFLNNGGGFDGYTPNFMLYKIDVNINSDNENM